MTLPSPIQITVTVTLGTAAKVALITDIIDQDSSCLAEFLSEKATPSTTLSDILEHFQEDELSVEAHPA